MQRRTTGRAGVSLAEMLVVLAIAGLMIAGGLPYIARALRVARLDSAASTVEAQLRVAATSSRATGQTFRVEFAEDGITVSNSDTGVVELGHERVPIDPTIVVDAEEFEHVVLFRRDGLATSGRIYVLGGFDQRGGGAEARVVVEVMRSGLVRSHREI